MEAQVEVGVGSGVDLERKDVSQEPFVYRALELMGNCCRLFFWLVAQLPRVVKVRLPSGDISGMADSIGAPIQKPVYQGLARLVGETLAPLPLDARCILFRANFQVRSCSLGTMLAVDGVNCFPVASKCSGDRKSCDNAI